MTTIEELKNTGLKATLPRLKILEIFQKSTRRHMTAEDVFRVLLEERSDVALATVYRVLTQFEQAAILSRSHFESGKAVYELNAGQPGIDHAVDGVSAAAADAYDLDACAAGRLFVVLDSHGLDILKFAFLKFVFGRFHLK